MIAGNLDTTNLLLGIMAAVSVLEALLLIGVGIMAWKLYGHAMHTILVDDLDAIVADIALRGIDPAELETYSNGVRKATYRDPDGNEIGFGGMPT